jgi:hypothetical protein
VGGERVPSFRTDQEGIDSLEEDEAIGQGELTRPLEDEANWQGYPVTM